MGKSVFMTGVAIANSMVGSSMIIFPLNFNKYGVAVNIIFVLFMGGIMSLTCKLLIDHMLPHEIDISQSIKRKLGPTYASAFGVMSSITLFLVSSVFFLLAVDIFYDVFLEIFGQISFPQKIFKLILMLVFASLNYLKDLKYVFVLTPVAMGALVISTITLIVSIPFNIDNIDSSFFDFQQLGFKDILTIASINGFAFTCHPSVSPMIKQNEEPKSNAKAIYIGFGITTVLYLLVGGLGALSIYGKHPAKNSNIIDYFSGQFQSPLIGFLNFIYLFLISAIFPFVSKNQALELIPQSKKDGIKNLWFKTSLVFGIIWIIMNTLFIIFDTSPIIVISFISAVMVFFITYFLPIFMTVKKGEFVAKNQTVVDESLESSLIVTEEKVYKTEATENQSLMTEPQTNGGFEMNKISLGFKIVFIGILTYGAIIFVSELISLFT